MIKIQTIEENKQDLADLIQMIEDAKNGNELLHAKWKEEYLIHQGVEKYVRNDIHNIQDFLDIIIPDVLLQEDLININGIKTLLEDREENLTKTLRRIEDAKEALEWLEEGEGFEAFCEYIRNLNDEIEWYKTIIEEQEKENN